jgi:acyl transferase domain-containing protein/acyl carrier protein/predicted choloylglycine hydrolase
LDEYWRLIADRQTAWGRLDASRLDRELYLSEQRGAAGKTYTDLGGAVAPSPFPRDKFRLSDATVDAADPSHLVFLEVVEEALRDAQLGHERLRSSATGVFVGHSRGSLLTSEVAYAAHVVELAEQLSQHAGFQRIAQDRRPAVLEEVIRRTRRQYLPDGRRRSRSDTVPSRAATLIAEAYGLDGLAVIVDAACASSLFALQLAANALQQGRIDRAIVGGASYSAWTSLVLFSSAQAVSATGSFPFDARADGFVSSDGYAAIVVERLSDAVAAGRPVIGVIRGIGSSSDGRGKSLWAPRKEGQVEAIRRAYKTGLDPSLVEYVECHGTSTQVGDATECESLTAAFGRFFPAGRRVPIQSVKANIGHCRETAGLAGLIKTLLAMRHEVIPAATNFETPSDSIPWGEMPFFVPTNPIPWPRRAAGNPRRAAVNTFGIGGLNVHVVVDDAPLPAPVAPVVKSRPERQAAAPETSSSDAERSHSLPSAVAAAKASHPAAAEPIAVIGVGAIFAGARTAEALRELFASGRDPKSEVSADRWDPELFRRHGADWLPQQIVGGFVTDFEYDWRKHKIPPKQVANADPIQFMVLDAAEQALEQAGWKVRPFDRQRCSVVVGTEFHSDFAILLTLGMRAAEFGRTVQLVMDELGIVNDESGDAVQAFVREFLASCPAMHDETGSYTSSTLASRISKTLDLMGGAFAIDAGECSAGAALAAAVDQLRSGGCDTVVCAGAQRSMDFCVYQSYANLALPSPTDTGRRRSRRDGFMPGEGAGVVVLKRLGDALRDRDAIQGVILSVGVASDFADPEAAKQRSISRAHETGGLSVAIPQAEQAAVAPAAEQLGHSQGASCMASLLKAVFTVQANMRSGDNSTRADVTSTGTSEAYHILVASPAADEPPAATALVRSQAPLIVRLGAASTADLAEQLEKCGESGACASELAEFSSAHRVRLAIVVEDRHLLGDRLKLARQLIENRALRSAAESQGIYLAETGDQRPRIGFLFAGQGSQYLGMFRSLLDSDLVARDAVDEMDAVLAELGLPAFRTIAWNSEDQLGTDVCLTQLAVLLGGVLMDRVVRARGIRPDVVSAHSFGEYAALVSAETWSLKDALSATVARSEAIESLARRGQGGAMWATSATEEDVLQMIEELKLSVSVFVANRNAPRQTVVSGRIEACGQLMSGLASQQFHTKQLAVPAAFHSPLMAGVGERLDSVLRDRKLRPPSVPFLSSVTNRYVAEPDDIRANLIGQLERPVGFVDLVRRLRRDGVTILIEIGPGHVLTKLISQIHDDGAVAAISSDHPKLNAATSLARLQALLECHGVPSAATVPIARESRSKRLPTKSRGVRTRARSPASPSAIEAGQRVAHFDATAARRDRLRNSLQNSSVNREAGTPSQGPLKKGTVPLGDVESSRRAHLSERDSPLFQAVTAATNETADELEVFLVKFVCDQTGYPPELVDIESDLEADLGIDSIRKAQLLGELREHFPIRPTSDLSLDDFRTLRSIAVFIRQSIDAQVPPPAAEVPSGKGAKSVPPGETLDRTSDVTLHDVSSQPARSDEIASAAAARRPAACREQRTPAERMLNVRRLSGSPREIGFQHGWAEREAIQQTISRFIELVGVDRLADVKLSDAVDLSTTYFGEAGMEELSGMAEALEIPVEHLTMFNFGLVVPVLQLLPGCTQFAVTARANGDEGLIHAANEDWNLGRVLAGAFKRVAQVRCPDSGIPCLTFSACGQLGGMNGINERGLAATSTLLLDRLPEFDRQPGLIHFPLVLKLLHTASSVDEAVDLVRSSERNSAWSLCLSDHNSDRICYLEYNADSVDVRWVDEHTASTNHCLSKTPTLQTPEQSCQRLNRLRELLDMDRQPSRQIPVSRVTAALRDQYDARVGRETQYPTKFTIRQPDTQASIVMRPSRGEVWVTADVAAPTDPHTYHRLDLASLFPADRSLSDGRRPAGTNGSLHPESKLPDRIPDGLPGGLTGGARVMNRFVMRMIDAPLPETSGQQLSGRALIVGGNAMSEALRRELANRGLDVISLGPTTASFSTDDLEALWKDGLIDHLFLTTARPDGADSVMGCGNWDERIEREIIVVYRICQHWTARLHQAGRAALGSLTAIVGLGGDLGLSGRTDSVEGGGLAGLLKAIHREFDSLKVKVIDAPSEDPPALVARRVWEELVSGDGEVEVSYVRSRRRVVRPIPRPLPATEGVSRAPGILRGGSWVITGGARGVTALVAREFAQQFGLRLHLLGTSPLPHIPHEWREFSGNHKLLRTTVMQQARDAGQIPAEAWRDAERALEVDANLRWLEEAGIPATYHPCDVSNREQLAEVFEEIRSGGEKITGILHGAGVEAACRFDKKDLDLVRRTVSTKVTGAAHLIQLTAGDPLEIVVGFGSISGRLGGLGQTDYSLASEMLAKLLDRFQQARPECRVVTVHWPPWDEVGMAARPESRLALEAFGRKFMPVSEGIDYLTEELASNSPEPELFLIDWPSKNPASANPWSESQISAVLRRCERVRRSPLLSGLIAVDETQSLTAEVRFDPARDPFLCEHRLHSMPILPAVIGLESLLEAATVLDGASGHVTITEAKIHSGWRFYSPQSAAGFVEIRRTGEREYFCDLRADFQNRQATITDPSRSFISANVRFDEILDTSAFAWTDPPPDVPSGGMEYQPETERTACNTVWQGPVFHVVRQLARHETTLWAEIIAPQPSAMRPASTGAGWLLPVAVFDGCLQGCSMLMYLLDKSFHLPMGFDRIVVCELPRPGEVCRQIARLRERSHDQAIFDFALFGAGGRMLLSVVGYRAVLVFREERG